MPPGQCHQKGWERNSPGSRTRCELGFLPRLQFWFCSGPFQPQNLPRGGCKRIQTSPGLRALSTASPAPSLPQEPRAGLRCCPHRHTVPDPIAGDFWGPAPGGPIPGPAGGAGWCEVPEKIPHLWVGSFVAGDWEGGLGCASSTCQRDFLPLLGE